MFYGKNIKDLRDLYGMSRRELGDKLSVTEQAIGQYENNEIRPEMTKLLKLDKIFNVKSKFFFSQSFRRNVTPESSVAYRSTDRDSRKNNREGVAQIDFADAIIRYCESFFNLKPMILKDLIQNEKNLRLAIPYDREQLIEKTASLTRKLLGIHHNRDLLFNVENAGVYIIEKTLSSKTGAYSAWTKNSDGSLRSPFIVLGIYNKTAVRRIFDVAHELGHLILHYDVDFNNLEKDDFKRFEKEANEFASALLLPKENMEKIMSMVRKKSIPDDYIPVKKEYWVSLVTIEYRAFRLGLITQEENGRFFINRYRRKYVFLEPLDRELPIRKPGKIEALLKLTCKNIMTLEDITESFNIEPVFLSKLFNIPNVFIDSLLPQNNSYKIYNI